MLKMKIEKSYWFSEKRLDRSMYIVDAQILQRGLRDLRVTGKKILDARVRYIVGQSETVY